MDEFAVLAGAKRALNQPFELRERPDAQRAAARAEARLGCSHAVQNCITAVDGLVAASGNTANFRSSALSTIHNDIRAVAGHFMVAPYQIDTAGRVLLSLDAGDHAF